MNDNILSCPFCRGKGKIHIAQYKFMGKNERGVILLKYRIDVRCNKCHSRGSPVITDSTTYRLFPNGMDFFKPYIERAILKWNNRA